MLQPVQIGLLLEHGENGFLVTDCADAINHVARINEIDRARCRQTVEEHFTADRMVEQYIEVYKQILKFPPVGRPKIRGKMEV